MEQKPVEQKQIEQKQTTIYKKEYAADDVRQQYIQYAYDVWGWDLVALMECENATRNPFRQSDVYKNGRREPSYGFCMIDRDYHKSIIDNKLFREDWKRQIDTCNNLFKWWTKFYGPSRYIKGQRCSSYVRDRFVIS